MTNKVSNLLYKRIASFTAQLFSICTAWRLASSAVFPIEEASY